MALVDIVVRPLLGVPFIVGGLGVAKDPAPAAETAEPVTSAIIGSTGLPISQATLVRANAIAQVAGGAALSLGILPRAASAGLIASLIPTTMAAHPFWTVDDPGARKMQLIQFVKNGAMLGGLIKLACARK